MEKAVFLDRDGVICKDVDHLHRKEEFDLIPRAAAAIKMLNQNDYGCIVISNQSVVARGLCSEGDLGELHDHLGKLLGEGGAKLDKGYYCPHHPEIHDDVPQYAIKYRVSCNCRKPDPGMIFQAKNDFQIENLENCYMIGDKKSDILAGQRAGCKTILVRTGHGGNEEEKLKKVIPDHVVDDLYSAVTEVILK